MIVRARVVVPMDGPPIDNGAVVISGDHIVDVGSFSEINGKHSREEIVELGDRALLPGIINAHCHLDYTCLRGRIPRQKSFTDWICAINAEKARLSAEDYVPSIKDGFAEAKRFGTTTIANLTAFPELVSRIEPPIRTWWFAELIDVRDPGRADEIVDSVIGQLKSSERWGLAPHAPFTVSADLYRRCEEIAQREDVLLTTHLAESREELEMFQDARGSLYEFLKEIGRPMTDCGKGTPLAEFLERSRATKVNHPYLVVHLNELAATDFASLAALREKFSVVHCPRSHEYFRHAPFPFEKLSKLGFNICLGTDSLASNDDLSLFAEMRAFQKEFPNVAPEEILKMVTVNPARALRYQNALGKLRPDFLADLIAVACEGLGSIYEQIIAFSQPISWATIGGRVLP